MHFILTNLNENCSSSILIKNCLFFLKSENKIAILLAFTTNKISNSEQLNSGLEFDVPQGHQ